MMQPSLITSDELLFKIFLNLTSVKDLCAASEVCRQWYRVAKDPLLKDISPIPWDKVAFNSLDYFDQLPRENHSLKLRVFTIFQGKIIGESETGDLLIYDLKRNETTSLNFTPPYTTTYPGKFLTSTVACVYRFSMTKFFQIDVERKICIRLNFKSDYFHYALVGNRLYTWFTDSYWGWSLKPRYEKKPFLKLKILNLENRQVTEESFNSCVPPRLYPSGDRIAMREGRSAAILDSNFRQIGRGYYDCEVHDIHLVGQKILFEGTFSSHSGGKDAQWETVSYVAVKNFGDTSNSLGEQHRIPKGPGNLHSFYREDRGWKFLKNSAFYSNYTFWFLEEGLLTSVNLIGQRFFTLPSTPSPSITYPELVVSLPQDALHRAIENGDEELAQSLIIPRPDIDWKNKKGDTALILATLKGYEAIVRLLIAAGAGVDVTGQYGCTALHWATKLGLLKIVCLLIDAKADKNLQTQNVPSPLNLAATAGHITIVRYLIVVGADVNSQDLRYGRTPLHRAAAQGHIEILNLVISAKAHKDVRDLKGNTPLHLAVKYGYTEIVRRLLDANADINIMNYRGQRPLDLVRGSNSNQIISLFKKETPLHFAIREDRLHSLRDLLNRGRVNRNAPNTDGDTPLHLAVQLKAMNSISCLLAYDVNLNDLNKKGMTPLDCALESKDTHLVNLLIKAGAKSRVDFS